jgi:hypothetical protein
MIFRPGRSQTWLSFLAAFALALGGCQSSPDRPAAPTGTYRVTWTAARSSDNVHLATFSSPVFALGSTVDVRTDSITPTDDRPAFPRFTAQLLADPLRDGTLQLVTRAHVSEVIHTKKGKRKIVRRMIGGLLPIHAGETQGINGPGDPIRLDVHLERARP